MTRDELLALIDQAAAEGWTELDLSGQGLTELPPEIGKLTQLETLILGKMEEKETFAIRLKPKLISNQLKALPSELTALKSLRKLDLSGNPLEFFPEEILQLQTLNELHLIDANISELPYHVSQLTNLTQLWLSSNQLTTIPECVGQLTNLTQLWLSSNQLTTIPECVGQLTNLTQLWLDNNQISIIPEYIGVFPRLTHLGLSNNQISALPQCLENLQQITHLYLHNNQLNEIPSVIGNLGRLMQISLSKNGIKSIPDFLGKLGNLTHVWLNNNEIAEIPKVVGKLVKLSHFTIGSNQINKISEDLGNLINLDNLGLSNNNITEIPRFIGNLRNLRSLTIAGNQISELPEFIRNLKKLEILWIHRNRITEIPSFICNLDSLNELALDDNQISVLPDCIGRLTNLSRLDLANNQISELPDSLFDLRNLKFLDLSGNNLPISPEILEEVENVSAILNYYRRLHGGVVRPLNEAKMLIIGQGTVGKTSLVKRLIENRFNPNEPQTDGLSVRNWGIHVNSKDVRLNVWDFGGQEIYHATHQFFLTKRSLYLLVCNCRTSEEENRIEYWLKLIQTFGGESPVIIVGNKKDEQPFDINRKALRSKYPNICAILETSCQSGDGIEDLQEAIREEVGKLHDVYNLLPLSWFEVKEQLEALDRDFISYGEYIGICYQHQISEERSQEQLITLLHNLGLVLNFREHPVLQNTNVLNPDWVTAGIYALLSDETLKTDSQGILDTDDLSRVLDPQRYPPERHRYLTDLMQEFQLCFALPDCPCPRFLIPGLLPKEEPADISLEGDTLEFQYHYRVWLGVVLYRFIVLSHEKIHNQTCWRSGVMLEYCEGDETCNIARIKADPEDKKIFISISGRETTRRIFLSLIRDTFTKIHKSFADLEVTEWVPVPDHPDHPPLDYQELLGLEAMGERDYPIGKLRIRVNLRQLLDGYEPFEARQSERFKERGMEDMGMPSFLPLPSRLPDIGIRPLASPKRGKAIPQERTELYRFALDLPSSQFDTVVFDLAPPKGNMPPVGSPQSQRVTALFEWLESPIGPGLAALRAALAKVTGWQE